ncbi:DUF4013 domain-containing protein [Methanobacterium alcaliphilum]|uniref:DUF4013 domain-containing protein n=1 Tax=Methanobacterium alcaliphilum TaxID=392018 RepID=UPI002009F0F2|nr:DUF4013 domain-containing protein [Methanobacterium alcaliphilum]MCK9150373.1 DUF4013 domain-containing protein [Methanobacterium alcaliphilum]
MNIKELFLDAVKYAASDWTKFILLGILFVSVDLLDRTTTEDIIPFNLWLVLMGILVIVFFIQAGYVFRIIETSAIDESDELPPFNNIKDLFKHGVKDSAVVMCYIIFPVALLALSTGITIAYINTDIPLKFPIIITLIFGIISVIFFIFMQAAILNMVHNHGKIRSAFNFKQIYGKIREIGVKKFLIVCLLTGIIFLIIEPFLLDDLRGSLDFYGGTILEFIVAPYLAILTSRFLGTMARH